MRYFFNFLYLSLGEVRILFFDLMATDYSYLNDSIGSCLAAFNAG